MAAGGGASSGGGGIRTLGRRYRRQRFRDRAETRANPLWQLEFGCRGNGGGNESQRLGRTYRYRTRLARAHEAVEDRVLEHADPPARLDPQHGDRGAQRIAVGVEGG